MGAGDMEFAEKFAPVTAKRLICSDDSAAIMIFADHSVRFVLVDDTVRFPFLFDGIFHVGQLEDHACAFAGSKLDIKLKDGAGRPAACYCILAGTIIDHFRKSGTSVIAYEGAPVGIKAADLTVYGEDGIHISALSVLRTVIDGGVIEFAVIVVTEIGLYFDFAGRKVSLEILLVIISIPEAPLNIRKYFEILFPAGFVLNIKKDHFAGVTHGNEVELADSYAVLGRTKAGVSHAMSALITVQLSLGRLPSSIPNSVFILYIYVLSVSVVGNVVIAIACDSQKSCILIKGITSACIGDQSEEVLVPEIVDPRERSSGSCNHILSIGVVEVSEFHNSLHVFDF